MTTVNYFKLAVKNIRHDLKNYLSYFISTTFAVMVFNIFSTVFFNPQFKALSQVKVKLDLLFRASAVVVAVFAAAFIWYANTFFIKQRKKEMATYSLLGLGKRQVAAMLFFENLITGLVSLICGIVLGTLFAKLFAMMLINLMHELVVVRFIVVWQAIGATALVFIILFLVNSVHAYSLIYRFKLIDLFTAAREGEAAPKASVISSVISLITLFIGYAIAIHQANHLSVYTKNYLLPVLSLIIAGTYLLFNNLIIIVIRGLKRQKDYYYQGINLISTSNLVYRIKGNAHSLAIIALLCALSITAIGTTYAYYKSNDSYIGSTSPYSFMHLGEDALLNRRVTQIIQHNGAIQLRAIDDFQLIEGFSSTPRYPGPYGKKMQQVPTSFISLSQYNRAMGHQRRPLIRLANDNQCFFLELNAGNGQGHSLQNQPVEVSLAGKSRMLTIIGSTTRLLINSNLARTTVVTTDRIYHELRATGQPVTRVRGYLVTKVIQTKLLTKSLKEIIPPEKHFSSQYDAYSFTYTSGGAILAIGIFLGFLFFLATGSIIYFKQLIEANNDRERFGILRRIGIGKNEIRKIVAKQLRVVFGLPMAVGICHSAVALYGMQKLLGEDISGYSLMIMGLFVLLYVGYYFKAVDTYSRIVNG